LVYVGLSLHNHGEIPCPKLANSFATLKTCCFAEVPTEMRPFFFGQLCDDHD
jgi:hypothetical protein